MQFKCICVFIFKVKEETTDERAEMVKPVDQELVDREVIQHHQDLHQNPEATSSRDIHRPRLIPNARLVAHNCGQDTLCST